MSMAEAIVRQDGEGERMWFAGGGTFTWKVTSEESDGRFLVIEDQMEQGKVTPLHLHPALDETIYVLEGELLVSSDGQERSVGPGGIYFAPRGLPHAFMVTSETARVLVFQNPGSGEEFYRAAGEPATEENADRPPDFERLGEVARRSPSIEILGPPPFGDQPDPSSAETRSSAPSATLK